MDQAASEALKRALKRYKDDDGNAAQAGLELACAVADLFPDEPLLHPFSSCEDDES